VSDDTIRTGPFDQAVKAWDVAMDFSRKAEARDQTSPDTLAIMESADRLIHDLYSSLLAAVEREAAP
jgi:hypothetical protein